MRFSFSCNPFKDSSFSSLKDNCRKFLFSPSTLLVFKFAFGAMAWQAVNDQKGVNITDNPEDYAQCCLFTGLADSAVSVLIDTLLLLIAPVSADDKSIVTEAKQISKNFIVNAVISGLWQPAVDGGEALGGLISKSSKNIFAGVAVFTMNAGLYGLLGRKDPKATNWLTAGLAELLFFLCGPIALPDSPSGNRTVTDSFLFTFAGAALGELVKKLRSTESHSENQQGLLSEEPSSAESDLVQSPQPICLSFRIKSCCRKATKEQIQEPPSLC